MSSLRLALKQSLEDTTKIDTDHNRRRLKKLKKKKKLLAAAQAAAAAAGNNGGGEGGVVNTEGAAGTTNLQGGGGNDVGAAIHYLKPATTTSGIRDPLKDGSASSSTLSSSDDDDDDDSSSSSSSSSSDSSSSSSDDDSDDDDDDDSSSSSSDSDDSSSSSSDSSSSSEDGNDTVDREAKQLFDADLSSSSGEDEHNHHVVTTHHDGSNPMMMDEDENSSTEKRRRKRLKKQSKTKLKARRKQQRERRDQNDAAVLIQSHWKKKAQGAVGGGDGGGSNVEEGRGYRPDNTHDGGEMKHPPLPSTATATAGEEQPTNNTNNAPSTTNTTTTSKKTSKTVEPPHPQILHHITLMSEKRQRRSIHTNLRVKVRFVKKANIQGKLTRKLKWYGGVIVGVGNKGRKVKIEYDDGTSEVADFPDKDIIVDDVNNGVHGSATVVGEGEKVVNKGSAFRPRSGDSKKEGGEEEKKQGGMMNVDDIVGAQVPATGKELSLSPPEEMSQDKVVEPTPRLVSNEIVVEGGAAVEEAASSIVKDLSTNENETSSSTPQQQQQSAPVANTAAAAADEKEEEKEEASSEEEGEILEETTAPAPATSTFAPTPAAAVEETNNTTVPGGFMTQGQLNPMVTKDADVPTMSSSLPQKEEAESVPPSHGSDEKKKIDESLTIGAAATTTTTTTAAVPSPSKKMAPEKEKEDNASSSSGSTCSSVSFAGPSSAADAAAAVADPAVVVKTNAENVPVEMPSHVDVNNGEDANGEATLFDDDEEEAKEPESSNGNDDDDDDEEEEGEIDEGDEAASSPPKDEPPVPKKRGPLRIRIGLSAAVKRKIEEEMDAMNEATPRSKKKAKLSSDDGDGDANMEDAPTDVALPSTETTEKLKEAQGSMTEELAPKKRRSVDSEDASDGENQEGSGSKKTSGVDGVAPPQRKKPGRKKKMTEIEKLKQDSIIEKTKQDSTLQDKVISMNEAVDADSGKSPRSFNSDTPEDDTAFSMARVGRKAAQRAAEKIAEKKTKKRNKDSAKESTEENTTTSTPAVKAKKEEDPWVQCDRCHKWRHLPATVNLDDLPEHWFCELNTHDPKRNNCEAAEQTPKEVAKEKKRAKKLAWKKLQMEQAQALAKEGSKKRARSASPPPRGIDKETEFDAVVATSVDKKSDDHDVNEATVPPPTTEPLPPKPKRRGRPPRSDKDKEKAPPNAPNAAPGAKGKDAPKQEWVQCEKCEKWRRLPPRISAEELPDVWYCSMNTWDINLATCTAIEDKHEENSKEYNVQSQIPTFAGSSSKTSYRNLIFGNGRQKRNISERMRAQESLFARDEEVDMSAPPTAMYAKSSAFFNKSLAKASAQETNKVLQPSIFDYMACSRVWAELNHMRRPNSKQHLYGYDKFCQPDGSLNKDSIDTLKAMSYFALGTNVLSGNEVLLQVQLQQWGYEVPTSWLELRSLSTIEIVNFILDELIKDGLVECIVPDKLSLDNVLYRQRTIANEEAPQQQGIQAAGCLKISKPWK